jgi:acyl-coenzyme A thioesterase PaaI-like protein
MSGLFELGHLGDSVTSEYKINFLRPALGDRIIAKATGSWRLGFAIQRRC